MSVEFLVLACSYKHKGSRCLVGADLTNKRLIRLVSRDETVTGAIKKEYCRFEYINIKPLDVIEIILGPKAPTIGAQTENYYVDMPFIVGYLRRATLDDLRPYARMCNSRKEYPIYPFNNKSSKLADYAYKDRKYSIDIIVGYDITGYQVDPNDEEKWKTKFNVYKHNGEIVELNDYSCTDSDEKYYKKPFKVGKGILVISLPPDSFENGQYYKIIAGIIDISGNSKK